MTVSPKHRSMATAAALTVIAGLVVVTTSSRTGAVAAPAQHTAVRAVTVSPGTAPISLAGTTTAAAALPAAAPDSVLPPAVLRKVLADQRAAGLDCSTSSRGLPICVHGHDEVGSHDDEADSAGEGQGSLDLDSEGASFAESTGTASGSGSGSSKIGCYGDGTSGQRVRAVYARPEGSADRYASSLTSIRSWAGAISSQFDTSAARTGGRRHVRWATTPGSTCSLIVLDVVLPKSAFGSFQTTIDALEKKGLHESGSKYLIWADASGYCGIGTTYADDSPGLDNLNNSGLPSYARVDRSCWSKAETHELVHMLGGVQRSAPHSTGGFHCNDGTDVMCYDDGTARSTQQSVCAKSNITVLDCQNNDYFSTAAPRGSYLQTHWNTARSTFLSATMSDPAPAATTTTADPTPAPSTSPAADPKPAPSATASPSTSPSASPSPTPSGLLPPGLLPPLPTSAARSTVVAVPVRVPVP